MLGTVHFVSSPDLHETLRSGQFNPHLYKQPAEPREVKRFAQCHESQLLNLTQTSQTLGHNPFWVMNQSSVSR
jgi:hypothetical protein